MAKPLVYLLNGNSNHAATERYSRAATTYFGERAVVETETLTTAPLYIATRRDCVRAAVHILDHVEARLARRDARKPDALILACFGEPGLGALRELSDIPMFGLLETSARAVAGLGKSFSILTPGRDWPAQMRELLGAYGLLDMCRGINVWPHEAADADLMFARAAMRTAIDEVAEREAADAIILGGPHAIGLGADRAAGRPVLVRDAFGLTLDEVAASLQVGG
jgi:Asp/Glu/hydantoin racemase